MNKLKFKVFAIFLILCAFITFAQTNGDNGIIAPEGQEAFDNDTIATDTTFTSKGINDVNEIEKSDVDSTNIDTFSADF